MTSNGQLSMTHIHYTEVQPDKLLAEYVHSFWQSKNDTEEAFSLTTLPDGCMELVIRFQRKQFYNLELANISKDPINFTMPAHQTKMGIRLKPLAKEYLLAQNKFGRYEGANSFILGNVSLSQLLTLDLHAFRNAMSDVFISMLSRNTPDVRKVRLFHLLHETQGDIKVGELAQSVAWTERQINRYFNKQFGMSLKSYCVLLKCYASYPHIHSGNFFPEQHFYDQPHFIREIKKHTGTTPERLWKNQNDRFIQFQKKHPS